MEPVSVGADDAVESKELTRGCELTKHDNQQRLREGFETTAAEQKAGAEAKSSCHGPITFDEQIRQCLRCGTDSPPLTLRRFDQSDELTRRYSEFERNSDIPDIYDDERSARARRRSNAS